MKLLRIGILLLFVSAAFAQRGGSRGGGGGGFRGGGGGGFRGGSSFSRGGGFGGSGFTRGFGGSGFNRGGFNRGFVGSRFGRGFGFRGSSRFAFGFGFGLGYPYYGWGYPGYYGYNDYYPYSYYYPPAYTYGYPSYYDSGPVVVNQNYGTPDPPPPPARIREYAPSQEPGREPLYLIAFTDHRITAAVAYWVEGDTLHYVTREHEHKQVPLDGVDRSFSEQLNRDRRVEFHLPR